MYAQVEKPKDNKSRAIANNLAQKRSTVKQGFGFVDNRPEAITKREFREIKNNSSQTIKTINTSNSIQNTQPVQCLLAGDPVGALEQRCLDFETNFDNQTNRLPLRFRWPADHPKVEIARAQLVLVRAPLGVDNRVAIEAQLNTIEGYLARLTKQINLHIDKLNTIAPVLIQFATELGTDFDGDLNSLRTALYNESFSLSEFNTIERNIYKRVEKGNKDMQKLRARNAGDASALVLRYVSAGLIKIGQINKYYCSPFDGPEDRFGAKASVLSGGSGAMQWARSWEFHIHGEAIRAGGANTPVTSFRIARGHIKPTAKKMDTGVSIEIADQRAIAAITNSSMAQVLRWANDSKRSHSVLVKQ